LVQLEGENQEAALADLRVVAELNPDNTEIQALVQALEAGESVTVPALGTVAPVAEPQPNQVDSTAVVSDTPPESDLLAPVNQVPTETTSETSTPIDATSETVPADASPVDDTQTADVE
jgi:hypothetical protein